MQGGGSARSLVTCDTTLSVPCSFTELWVPAIANREDLLNIITERMAHPSLHTYVSCGMDGLVKLGSLTGFCCCKGWTPPGLCGLV